MAEEENNNFEFRRSMMKECNWIELGKSKKTKYDPDRFLRVKPDCRLNVRLIDKPLRVVRIYSNNKKCAILDGESTGKMLKEKYSDKLIIKRRK